MEITHAVETPEGAVVFQAKLDAPALKALIEYALTDLISKGLVPFQETDTKELHDIHAGPRIKQ